MEEVMLDHREVFSRGFLLEFREDCSYTITEEIGRGKSCLVYGAYYQDNAGCSHQVRIKECYPYGLEIHRKEDGALEVSKKSEALFEKAKERFYKSYQDNVNLKNISGLTNSTVNAVNFLRKNNTCYSVVECVEGSDYRAEVDADLPSLLIRIRTLARIIKKYHDRNLLHLDIKPENILVLPETNEHMVLFDFDSVFAVEDLKKEGEELLSLSEGFAAPELLLGKWEKVCAATDIYSIGAVLFYKLFGRKPNAMDMAAGSKFDFTQMKYADRKYIPEFYKKLERFLHKTISSSVSYRFRKIDEVLEMLEELIALSTSKEKPRKKKTWRILAGILIAALFTARAAWYFAKDSRSREQDISLAGAAQPEERDEEFYLRESDCCLLEGKYLDAVQVLVDARRENGYGRLLEREEYLREHIQVTKKTTYPKGDGAYGTIIEEYFENGNQKRVLYYNVSGDAISRGEKRPDGSIQVFYDDWMMDGWSENTYEYDEDGRISEICEVTYGADGNSTSISIQHSYLYDEAGRVLRYGKTIGYVSDGKIEHYLWENQYDETGNLAEDKTSKYNADLELEWELPAKYEYDEKGNPLKMTWYEPDGRVWGYQYEYQYDEDGYLVRSTTATFGELMSDDYYDKITYNILGLEVEKTEILDECFYSYEYEFTGELPESPEL